MSGTLLFSLAWRDLWQDRFFLFCNIAVLVGILVPLMVLYGVKNGVTRALLEDLASSPTALQIDTLGNKSFTPEQLASIGEWPGVAFVAPRARSAFDAVWVRKAGGRRRDDATLTPSGLGDPNLPAGLDLGPDEVAVSHQVARRIGAVVGDSIELIGALEPGDRQGNLRVEVKIKTVVAPERIAGSAVLAPFALSDAFEALYEGYSVPKYGVMQGVPIETRRAAYEGVRIYAESLPDVVSLQARLGAHLEVAVRGISEAYLAQIAFSRNLTLVLALTGGLAAIGLGAALVTRAYADVMRKRLGLASLAMLGLPPMALAALPVIQAGFTAALGLAVAFPAFVVGALLVDYRFAYLVPGEGSLAFLYPSESIALIAVVMLLSVASAGLAARATTRLDPASVLREGS